LVVMVATVYTSVDKVNLENETESINATLLLSP
jgi:hypothetical protein